jgi:crotonobetainyl-CoA:carnitine CoA-transferase CaiB-like acyl-CoA transferase
MDLFERWPGSKFADHAKGNLELRKELVEIFKTRTTADWVAWSGEVNTTLAPVNTPETLADDPQFKDRLGFMPYEGEVGAEMQPYPVKFVGEPTSVPAPAPTVGEHTDEVLTDVLGYDAARIAELRSANAFGPDGQ